MPIISHSNETVVWGFPESGDVVKTGRFENQIHSYIGDELMHVANNWEILADPNAADPRLHISFLHGNYIRSDRRNMWIDVTLLEGDRREFHHTYGFSHPQAEAIRFTFDVRPTGHGNTLGPTRGNILVADRIAITLGNYGSGR